MNYRIRNNYFQLVLIVLFISGCNSGNKRSFSVLPVSMQSTEKRIITSYINHIKNVSTPEFPLHSFRSNADLLKDSGFSSKICRDSDLIFFPATLWQVYKLKETGSWNQLAHDYNKEIQQCNTAPYSTNGKPSPSVLLMSCELDSDNECLTALIHALSKYISAIEEQKGSSDSTLANTGNKLELLLENQVLFFATKFTGDPVYRNFAIENSTFLHEKYFQNDKELESALTSVTDNKLELLTTKDFRILATCLYGFASLYHETGMEDYLHLCEKIAFLFATIFDSTENTIPSEKKQAFINKIDLVSQSLVSLALFDLAEFSKQTYRESSMIIYKRILTEIEKLGTITDEEHMESVLKASFRLFYYLFEYELRSQNKP